MASLERPIFNAPKSPPDWHGPGALDELRKHLQTALLVELHTIPLYLFAAYSINDNPLSTYKIVGVVKQEMLHLGLAGNILCALGGAPKLYGEEYTPTYPVGIFYEEAVKMELKPATRDNIATFEALEKPAHVPLLKMRKGILPEYHSIGEFYQATLDGLKTVALDYQEKRQQLFDQSSIARQFQTPDGSWYDDDMIVIHNLKSAVDALTIVIEQGEGSTGVQIKNTIQSHYEVFKELVDDVDKHPLVCYPVVENPITEDYNDLSIYKVMLASDAAYSYLLLTLEKMWTYDGDLRGRLVTKNIMELMLNIQKPLALFLVAQPLKDGKNAAAPFNLYKFQEGSSAFEQLKGLTREAVAAYPDVADLKVVQGFVDGLIDISVL